MFNRMLKFIKNIYNRIKSKQKGKAMKYTPKFNFALPENEDEVDYTVLNGNMSKIDDILEDIESKLPPPSKYTITVNSETGTIGHNNSYPPIAQGYPYFVYGEMDKSINLQKDDIYKVTLEIGTESPITANYFILDNENITYDGKEFNGFNNWTTVAVLDKCQWDLSSESDAADYGTNTAWRLVCGDEVHNKVIPSIITLERLDITPVEISIDELTDIGENKYFKQYDKCLDFYKTVQGWEFAKYNNVDPWPGYLDATVDEHPADYPEGVVLIKDWGTIEILNHAIVDPQNGTVEYSENACAITITDAFNNFGKLVIRSGSWVE